MRMPHAISFALCLVFLRVLTFNLAIWQKVLPASFAFDTLHTIFAFALPAIFMNRALICRSTPTLYTLWSISLSSALSLCLSVASL